MLAFSIGGYRAWKRGGKPDRTRLTNARAVALMNIIHAEFKGTYGSRLMNKHGIRARRKRRFKATTDSKHSMPVAENLLARNFTPETLLRVCTGNFTHIPTGEGWLYLAIVLDLFNREDVGWSIKPRMTAKIVTDALTMARLPAELGAGVVFHSNRGSQYASGAMLAKLAECGMIASMSRNGDCWDNVPTESFFNSLRNERVLGTTCATRSNAQVDLFEYIEVL